MDTDIETLFFFQYEINIAIRLCFMCFKIIPYT